MRVTLLALPLATLSACAAPVSQSAQPEMVPTAFNAPMDPGTIPCGALSNPNALDVASEWMMGRARAASLTGRIATVPDETTVGANLARYCGENPNATVRSAASQLGF